MLELGISGGDIIPACESAEVTRHEGHQEGGGVGPLAETSTASIIGTGLGSVFVHESAKEAVASSVRYQVVVSKRGDRQQRSWPVALLLLRDMSSLGVKPTATSYEVAIRACR